MATLEEVQRVQKQIADMGQQWRSTNDPNQRKQLSDSTLALGNQIGAKRNESAGTWDYSGVKVDPTPKPSYLDQMTSQIGSMFDQQKAAQLAALKAQRDQTTGQLNQQKAELTPQYYGLKNQAGADNAQQVQRLREVMAANGLSGNTAGSGENVTANVGLGAALQNNLGNLTLQQQQQENDISRRISDINNPAQEQALIANIEAAKSQMLYDAQQKAHQFDYQVGRDQQGDAFTRGQLTGSYVDPGMQELAQKVIALKYQNDTGGNPLLGQQADLFRNQLNSQYGIDANALFGANVTAQQAAQNLAKLQQSTLAKQQQDYQKSTDQRNFNYQVGRDNVGDTRYNNEFAYKQQRDTVGDSQWNQQFDYQAGRDQVGDARWSDQFNSDNAWKERNFNNDNYWNGLDYNNATSAQKAKIVAELNNLDPSKAAQYADAFASVGMLTTQEAAEIKKYLTGGGKIPTGSGSGSAGNPILNAIGGIYGNPLGK